MGVCFMSNNKKENRYYNNSLVITNMLTVGFFGGVIASLLGLVAHYFNFMDFSPKFILTSWSKQVMDEGLARLVNDNDFVWYPLYCGCFFILFVIKEDAEYGCVYDVWFCLLVNLSFCV